VKGRIAYLACCGTWIALIFLGLAWELWLAPLRPGGSWLVLKILPLLIPLRGILHGRAQALKWATLLVWAYFAEGLVRALSDRGASATLGVAEVALSLAFFAAAVASLRASRSA
jgi:uncharacterized membrane protein